MSFTNINAIISGGASGLGLAVARRVVAAQGRAVILDIDADKGHAAVDSLGTNATYIHTDTTSETSVNHAVSKATSIIGEIRLCVNCAGVVNAQRVLGKDATMSSEAFTRVVNVNLVGTFNVCKAAATVMQHNIADDGGERGVIVNTASVAAFEGQIGQAAYAASKGGVAAMTLPLARELAHFGVRTMSIAPGTFATPMMAQMPANVKASLAQSTPFPSRLGRPDEFAALVAHICDNAMLNGETIRLDGAIRMPAK